MFCSNDPLRHYVDFIYFNHDGSVEYIGNTTYNIIIFRNESINPTVMKHTILIEMMDIICLIIIHS